MKASVLLLQYMHNHTGASENKLHNPLNQRRLWHTLLIFISDVTFNKNICRNVHKNLGLQMYWQVDALPLNWLDFLKQSDTGSGGNLCYLGNSLHTVSLRVCFGSWELPESSVSQVWNKNISLQVLPWNSVCLFLKYYDGKSILQIQWMLCV